MRKYLARRLLLLIPVVFGVATAVFMIIHLIPGDPVEIMLGEQASPADRESLRKTLGLDRPIAEQYFHYLSGLMTGRLGDSLHHRRGVTALVLERLLATLELGVAAMTVAIFIALPLGILSAARARSWVDHGSMAGALLGVSIPNFWLGPLLISLFSLEFNWLPPSGRGGWSHLILPALTLGTGLAAILTRMTRASVLEVSAQGVYTHGSGQRPFGAGRPHPPRLGKCPLAHRHCCRPSNRRRAVRLGHHRIDLRMAGYRAADHRGHRLAGLSSGPGMRTDHRPDLRRAESDHGSHLQGLRPAYPDRGIKVSECEDSISGRAV